MAEKRKLRKLRKIRDSHRRFTQKTIDSARELIAGGDPIDVKKLKFLLTTLHNKKSRIQALDRDVVELQEDDSNIDKAVFESCEVTSTIYECIVELESVLAVKEALERSRKLTSTPESASCSESAGTLSTSAAKSSDLCQITKTRVQEILRECNRMVSVLGILRVARSQEWKPV